MALRSRGQRLNYEVYSGDRLAVMGPWDSGASDLLEVVAGHATPEVGQAALSCKAVSAGLGPNRRRQTPLSIAQGTGATQDQQVAALSALGLESERKTPLAKLDPSQEVVCELLPALLGQEELALIDGHLDILDPWRLEAVMDLLSAQPDRAVVAATNSPSIAERFGSLLVLREGGATFSGTARELISRVEDVEVEVETEDGEELLQMIQPFVVSVHAASGVLRFRAKDGQAAAAKLLTLGYGKVRVVALRHATLAEALLRL